MTRQPDPSYDAATVNSEACSWNLAPCIMQAMVGGYRPQHGPAWHCWWLRHMCCVKSCTQLKSPTELEQTNVSTSLGAFPAPLPFASSTEPGKPSRDPTVPGNGLGDTATLMLHEMTQQLHIKARNDEKCREYHQKPPPLCPPPLSPPPFPCTHLGTLHQPHTGLLAHRGRLVVDFLPQESQLTRHILLQFLKAAGEPGTAHLSPGALHPSCHGMAPRPLQKPQSSALPCSKPQHRCQ